MQWGKGAHTFPKSMNLKVNIIAWLEFKLDYFKAAVQHFSYYATRTPQGYKEIQNFLRGISLKVNIIVQLEIKLTHCKLQSSMLLLSLALLWHKARHIGHQVRIKFTNTGLLIELANHYTKTCSADLAYMWTFDLQLQNH